MTAKPKWQQFVLNDLLICLDEADIEGAKLVLETLSDLKSTCEDLVITVSNGQHYKDQYNKIKKTLVDAKQSTPGDKKRS